MRFDAILTLTRSMPIDLQGVGGISGGRGVTKGDQGGSIYLQWKS